MFGKLSRILGISSIGITLSYQGFSYFPWSYSKAYTVPEKSLENNMTMNHLQESSQQLSYSEIFSNYYLPTTKE